MYNNKVLTSHQIGKIFEDVINYEIFTEENYELIYRTASKETNNERFNEETLKPDFKFRCKKTNQIFYVEAKYRSKFNYDNKLYIFNNSTQFYRFKNISLTDKPVFLAIGYEGTPNNPKYISLIKIDVIEYKDLFRSFLSKYNIEKKSYPNEKFNFQETNEAFQQKIKSTNVSKTIEENNTEKPIKKQTNKSRALLFASLIALLLTVFIVHNISNSTATINKIENSSDINSEREKPSVYLETSGNFKKTINKEGINIHGIIKNKALKTSYGSVVLKVTYYDKSKNEITTKYFTLSDNFNPKSSKNFELYIKNYKNATSVKWDVVAAKAL